MTSFRPGPVLSQTTKMPDTGTKVARNSAWNLAGWLALLILGFASAPYFLRMLGSGHYGLLALLTALVTPFGLLELGMSEATVKFVAESFGLGEFKRAEKYINTTLCFNLAVGVVGALVIMALSGWMSGSVFKIAPVDRGLAQQCLIWVAFIWALTRVRQTLAGVAAALRNYQAVSVGNFAFQATNVSTGLLVLYLGGDLLALVRAQAIVALAGVIAWFVMLRWLVPEVSIRPRVDRRAFRESFHFGIWQLGNNLGDIFTQQAQRWQLGAWVSLASVGFYNLAYQLVLLVYSISSRVGQVFFPEISRLHGQGREKECVVLLLRVSWLVSCLQIPGYVVLFGLSYPLLNLWAGTEVASNASSVLKILSVGLAIASLFAVPSSYLLGVGKPRWLALMSGAQATLTVVTAAYLIPRFGVDGAACALTAGTAVHLAVLLLMWQRLFHSQIPFLEYFVSTFGSLLVGVPCGLALSIWSTSIVRIEGFLATGGSSLGGGVISLGICLAVSRAFPGGRERWEWLSESVRSVLSKYRNRPSLA